MAEVSLTSINTISKDLQTLTLTGIVRVDRESLGSGAYGKVFAVKHEGKTYAAKEIHSILLETVSIEEKRAVRDNFLKECHQCSILRHPNIVRFIGVYYPDWQSVLPVMVMELMDTNLKDYVETPNISMKLKISILHDISQGLSFLHDRASPIIHRDLSPNNVLLSRDLVAKISDLGVAKVVKVGTKNTLTKAPGTTDFMPPEALADHPKYFTGLDVFSYGGLILHTVNQEWPTPTSHVEFDHKMKPIKMLTEVERRQKYLDMMTAEAEVLKSLVVRCLENDPANRPTSADLLKTLNQLEKQQGYEVIDNPNWNKPGTSYAHAPFTYAILLENHYGYKETSPWKDFTKWAVGTPYTKKMVLAGNLLQILSDDEVSSLVQHSKYPPNYKVVGESGVRLHCNEALIHPLTTKQKDFLIAVKSAHDRVAIYQNLEWVEQLQVGSRVYLRVHNVYEPVRVTVHYIGKLLGENGIRFGVELLSWNARGKGSTDGIFQNIRHFNCEKDCGLFISMEKLTKEPPPTHVVIPFKIGDKVTTFDVKGKPVRGTVAWIGKNKEAMPDRSYIIGVYTDEFIVDINNRFPVRIANMDHMINYSVHNTRLFLPAVCFIAGSVDSTSTNHRHGHGYNTRHADSNQSFNTSAKAAGKNSGLGSQERDMFGEADRIHRREAAQKWKKQDDLERVQKAESGERRHRQIQAKEVLKIGDTIDFDDTIFDLEKHKEIFADLKKRMKNVIGDADEASGMPPHHDQSHGNVGSSSGHYTPNNGNSSHHELSNLPPVQEARNFNHTDQQQQQRQQQSSSSTRPSQVQEDWQKQQQKQQLQQQWEWQQQQWQQQQWQQQQQQWQQQQQQQWQQQQLQQQQQQQWHQQQQHQQFLQQKHWEQEQQQKHWQQPQPNHAYAAPFDRPAQAQQQQWDQREQQQQRREHEQQHHKWQQQQHDKQPIGMDNILRAEHATPGPIANQRIPENSTGGFQRQKLHVYEEIPGEPTEPPQPKYNLSNGSMVETGDPDSPLYGVIKWIGYLPGSSSKTAGVEMEETIFDGGDGAFDGFEYFECQTGHGMFVRLEALRPDIRFTVSESLKAAKPNPLGEFHWITDDENKTFHRALKGVHEHKGSGKGIQGHQNSCYLDATLFGMFAYAEVFDDLVMQQEARDPIEINIKTILRGIVNLLRQKGIVHYNAIMSLRTALDKLEQMKGLKSEEKDPEEFLNLLFKHVLHVEAFLRIRRPSGEDKEYFVQLFVEPDQNSIRNTQSLLCDMFLEQNISFQKYPMRLLLQIPRYGKQFKSFKAVIPSLELDVSILCEGFAGPCLVCGRPGEMMCSECHKQEFKPNTSYYFCGRCSALWHENPMRQGHKPVRRQSSSDAGRLQLLSVLCIETSHYVCFTRITGSGKDEWVFFDSMAERPDDVHNIPCVSICTEDLNEWVYGKKDLTAYTSKDLPPLVRRFIEDGYLCIYVDHDGIMYG